MYFCRLPPARRADSAPPEACGPAAEASESQPMSSNNVIVDKVSAPCSDRIDHWREERGVGTHDEVCSEALLKLCRGRSKSASRQTSRTTRSKAMPCTRHLHVR